MIKLSDLKEPKLQPLPLSKTVSKNLVNKNYLDQVIDIDIEKFYNENSRNILFNKIELKNNSKK
tara:strand:+ start:353 stop:544 length:192 start_codon:yes stop_codon:yes gene_type:complete